MNITTRKQTSTNAARERIERVMTERLAARLDADAPAKVRARSNVGRIVPDETVLRVPDFRDEEGMAVFIGEDATVLVEEATLERLTLLVHVAGIHGRGGRMPEEQGIAVYPHSETLASPTYAGRNGEAQMAWRLVTDTLVLA